MDKTAYTAAFNAAASSECSENREWNLVFLKKALCVMNDTLKCRGHVFLNDVRDMLGLERTSRGQLVGWLASGGEIDFGIAETENGIELDFNVQGIIFDLL